MSAPDFCEADGSPALKRAFEPAAPTAAPAAPAPTGPTPALAWTQSKLPSSSFVNPMLTDFYQLTMAYAYWRGERHNDASVFELFFRKNPFHGEFTIFAGLSEVLRFISNFRFSERDVEFIKKSFPSDTPQAFFDYLLTVDCSEVIVSSMSEGSVVFPRCPIIRIEGPLLVCQLLETTLLNLTNFPSLICTNAARMRLVSGEDKTLLEFGLRRAQGPDGAVSASRYSYMGGFDGSSNVLACQLFDIAVRGTHAHSYISSFNGKEDLNTRALGECEDFYGLALDNMEFLHKELKIGRPNDGELAAFVSYAQAFPDKFNALVDTYDTLKSGVINFLAVAAALGTLGKPALGVRLDSGDLAFLSLECRKLFAKAGELFKMDFGYLQIMASNDINEGVLASLAEQGHSIDVFGIGTNLVTCQSQPALGMVFKLVEIKGKPVIKLSNESNKVTIPGKKQVYRLMGVEGHALCDLMVSSKEPAPVQGQKIKIHHPTIEHKRAYVTPSFVMELLRPVFIGPEKLIAHEPSLGDVRQFVKDQLSLIRSDHKRALNPSEYKVSVTNELFTITKNLWADQIPIPELQ